MSSPTALARGAALGLTLLLGGAAGAAMAQEPASAAVTSAASAIEVSEVRLHGNHSMTDAEILAIAGVAVGDRLAADDTIAVEERLRASGRFDQVSAEWRYRSLTRRDRAVLLLTVHEKIGVADKFLVLPEIRYNEDEKFSVGGRVSVRNLFGGDTLISLPVLVGGVDRVALEVSRRWDSGVGVGGQFQWRQYENPFARVKDQRTGGGLWLEQRFGEAFSVRADGDYHDVEFGGAPDTLLRYGVTAALDTRPGRNFPYNSVFLSAGWQRVEPDAHGSANRYRMEVAAYKTLLGQTVLAARGLLHTADAPLPAYERPYVGGMQSLRGTKAGTFQGDSTAQGTVELRIPITGVLTGSIARVGLVAFWDTAAVWDYGDSLGGQKFHHGVGGGVYVQAPLVRLNLDVGNNLEGNTRVHFGLGFRF